MSVEDYRRLLKCLLETSKTHNRSVYEVLECLGAYDKYKDIPIVFRKLDATYFEPYLGNKKPDVPDSNYDEAEGSTAALKVSVTGARAGDILLGVEPTSKNAIIRIDSGFVKPEKKKLDFIRNFPGLWKLFLNNIGAIPFYKDLSLTERESYLESTQVEGDIDIADFGVTITVLQIGDSTFRTLDPEDILYVSTHEKLNALSVRNMFPRKVGSNTDRQTLIFLRTFWKIHTVYEIVESHNGVVIDSDNGVIYNGYAIEPEDHEAQIKGKIDILLLDFPLEYTLLQGKFVKTKSSALKEHENEKYIISTSQKVGVMIYRDNQVTLSYEYIRDVISKYFEENDIRVNPSEIDDLRLATSKFTAAGLKSLLQKLVRFNAGALYFNEIDEQTMETMPAVIIVFSLLLIHPGSFVPDIQRFVSGLESATKRLFVTIMEDAYAPPEKENICVSLLVSALIAQRYKGWRPTLDMLINWYDLIASLFDTSFNRTYYKFSIDRGIAIPPYTVNSENTPLANCSAILDVIKSFNSDLGMVRDIASRKAQVIDGHREFPEYMHIRHCIDQHCAPEIAYFVDPEISKEQNEERGNAKKNEINTSKPFSGLFSNLFYHLTGFNPRKRPLEDLNRDVFAKKMQVAQELTLFAKTEKSVPRIITTRSKENFEGVIPYEALAGMLGSFVVEKKYIVTPNIWDPTQFSVIRRPTRQTSKENDNASITVPENIANRCIATVKEILEKGVSIDHIIPAPLPGLVKKRVHLIDDAYCIFSKGKFENITNFFTEVISIPIHQDDTKFADSTWVMNNAITFHGEGLQYQHQRLLYSVLSHYSIRSIRRLLSYLSGVRSQITFPHISKDGGGTDEHVTFEDVTAYQLFLALSVIYPRVIRRKEYTVDTFLIDIPPFLWKIRKDISDYIIMPGIGGIDGEKDDTLQSIWNLSVVYDRQNRKLYSHQVDAITEMKERHEAGFRGNVVDITAGLGKTLIVLEYSKWLIGVDGGIDYIIYTYPSPALTSMVTEILNFGFKVNIVIPLKGKPDQKYLQLLEKFKYHADAKSLVISGDVFLKGYVNLIEHDHLRRSEKIYEAVSSSILIVDEVHKALTESIRTKVCLELSKSSIDFIAMTGTPVIDNNVYRLIWWLEQIVPFEVNQNNFWVAVNSMVSKQVEVPVKINEVDIPANFNVDEAKAYYNLVPPALGGRSQNMTMDDLKNAMTVCYTACTREMVKQVLLYINLGLGVFLVAHNSAHADTLRKEIISKGVRPNDIFMIDNQNSIYLTDETVDMGKIHDYKVVITTVRKCEGYSLTRLKVMIWSVYPSNQATRTQIKRRVVRIGQSAKEVNIVTVHTGILTYMHKKHVVSANLEAVLRSVGDLVKMESKPELEEKVVVNNIISDDFPYKRLSMTPESIKKRFENLQNYKPITVSRKYEIKNLPDVKDLRYRGMKGWPQVIFKMLPENYEKYDNISSYFVDHILVQAKRYDEKLTPFEYWQNNKKIIRKEAGKKYGKVNNYTMREIIYKRAHEVSTFRPTVLVSILKTFYASKLQEITVLDPCSGWGDRLIAAMACKVKKYIGVDPNEQLQSCYQEMISMFNTSTVCEMICSPFEDVNISKTVGNDTVDIVVTSPPYFDLEVYVNPTTEAAQKQSINRYPSLDGWFDNFLMVLIKNSIQALKPKGYLCIIINDIRNGPKYVEPMIHATNALGTVDYFGVISYAEITGDNVRSPQPVWIWRKK